MVEKCTEGKVSAEEKLLEWILAVENGLKSENSGCGKVEIFLVECMVAQSS